MILDAAPEDAPTQADADADAAQARA